VHTYYFNQLGIGIEGLALGDLVDPELGPADVLIKVHACSLNRRDLRILEGLYPIAGKVGLVPLSDGAGEVLAVGQDVQRFKVGDRVAATYFPLWSSGRFSMQHAVKQLGCTINGMLAPFAVAHEDAVVNVPPHLSFAEAATLPCAALTAWCALLGPRPILSGETVLTIGTGSVALFAVQFAKMLSAHVISITSTDSKAERLRQLGADEVVNYRSNPQWELVVRKLTAGRGATHVVETGALDTLSKSISCTAEEGVVSIVAALGQGNIDARVFGNPIVVRRVCVGSRSHFEAMNSAITEHKMRPIIAQIFSFADAIKAYRHFEAGNQVGKVVITCA